MARVNEGSHVVLPATHTSIHKRDKPYALNPLPHSVASLWLILIFRPAEGRRLSWSAWLGEILRWFVHLKTVNHPGICRGGRELNPRPSSREFNALDIRLPNGANAKIRIVFNYFVKTLACLFCSLIILPVR